MIGILGFSWSDTDTSEATLPSLEGFSWYIILMTSILGSATVATVKLTRRKTLFDGFQLSIGEKQRIKLIDEYQ